MTQKQFTIVNMGLDGQYIKENGKIMTIERVVNLLNENEQLKKELENNIASYKKCNRRVFDLIDKKIKEVDTIGVEVLKDLKKELQE